MQIFAPSRQLCSSTRWILSSTSVPMKLNTSIPFQTGAQHSDNDKKRTKKSKESKRKLLRSSFFLLRAISELTQREGNLTRPGLERESGKGSCHGEATSTSLHSPSHRPPRSPEIGNFSAAEAARRFPRLTQGGR